MLVETKARVGVFAIALGAYLPQFPTLVPEFEQQYAAFKKTIPDTVEVIDGGIVTTKELSMAAGDKFRAADVDLVILQLLTYATTPTPIRPPGWVNCTPAVPWARWWPIWSVPASVMPSSPVW